MPDQMSGFELADRLLAETHGDVLPLLKLTSFTESNWLEFKAGPRWLPLPDEPWKTADDVLWHIARSIVGFANGQGGVVLLGVKEDDAGKAVFLGERGWRDPDSKTVGRDTDVHGIVNRVLPDSRKQWTLAPKEFDRVGVRLAAGAAGLHRLVEPRFVRWGEHGDVIALLVRPLPTGQRPIVAERIEGSARSGINWSKRATQFVPLRQPGHYGKVIDEDLIGILDAWPARDTTSRDFATVAVKFIDAAALARTAAAVMPRPAVQPTEPRLDVPLPDTDLTPTSSYQPLRQRLAAHGIAEPKDPMSKQLVTALGGAFSIGEMVELTSILRYNGLPAAALKPVTRAGVQLLPWLKTAVAGTVVEGRNRPKLFLLDFEHFVLDKGHMALDVGIADYRTFKTIRENLPRIRQDVASGAIAPEHFCGRLNIQIIVVTADNQVILGRRRAGLDDEPETWSILGESIDGEDDLDASGTFRPELTVQRALREDDELGIPRASTLKADIKFLAIARKGSNLLTDMVAFVQLVDQTGAQVVGRSRPGEHTHVDAVPFSIEACLEPLVLKGQHVVHGFPTTAAAVNDFSRYGLFCALCHRFGYDVVDARVA